MSQMWFTLINSYLYIFIVTNVLHYIFDQNWFKFSMVKNGQKVSLHRGSNHKPLDYEPMVHFVILLLMDAEGERW